MLTISILIFIGVISAINYSMTIAREEGKKIREKNPNKKLYPRKVFKNGKTFPSRTYTFNEENKGV